MTKPDFCSIETKLEQITDFWSPDAIRTRLAEFMQNGGQAQLDALKREQREVQEAVREALCPDPSTFDEPMTF